MRWVYSNLRALGCIKKIQTLRHRTQLLHDSPALQGPQTAQNRAYTPDFNVAGSASSDFDDETLINPSSGGRRRVNPNIVSIISVFP
jgi:hypothetical protein